MKESRKQLSCELKGCRLSQQIFDIIDCCLSKLPELQTVVIVCSQGVKSPSEVTFDRRRLMYPLKLQLLLLCFVSGLSPLLMYRRASAFLCTPTLSQPLVLSR